MTEISPSHNPVMVNQVIDCLSITGKKVFVDGTLGLGGYTEALLKAAGPNVKVIAFELDQDNLEQARERLRDYQDQIIYINENFAKLEEVLQRLEFSEIDGLMLDLGLSSPQLDRGEKGFSFMREGKLDMRFDQRQQLTAEDVVNNYSEEELTNIFREYGEERQAKRYATQIVRARQEQRITTTKQLAELIVKSNLNRNQKTHPATLVFQAIRIEVNMELESLVEVLNQSLKVLRKGGRMVIVSYHSLEDRIVKLFFKERSREYINLPNELTTTKLNPELKILSKKPLVPEVEEITQNPRARSAKLRYAEKII